MFTIRSAQHETLYQGVRAPFHGRVLRFVRSTLPARTDKMDDATLLKRIATLDAKAVGLGLRTERGITQFVSMDLMVPNFSDTPAAEKYLRLPVLDPDRRMDLLLTCLADHKRREQAGQPSLFAPGMVKFAALLVLSSLAMLFFPDASLVFVAAAGSLALGAMGAAATESSPAAALGPVGWAAIAVVVLAVGAAVVYHEINKVEEDSKDVPKSDAPTDTESCPNAKPKEAEVVLDGAKPGNVGKTKQYTKPGGFSQANDDFDEATKGLPVKDQGGGIRSATLSDGSTISVRPQSSQGSPTIQINPPTGKPIKVRYE